MPFEHGFYLKMHIAGHTFFHDVTLFYVAALFRRLLKFLSTSMHASFGAKYVPILLETIWPTLKTFAFLCYFRLYFQWKSLRKCRRPPWPVGSSGS